MRSLRFVRSLILGGLVVAATWAEDSTPALSGTDTLDQTNCTNTRPNPPPPGRPRLPQPPTTPTTGKTGYGAPGSCKTCGGETETGTGSPDSTSGEPTEQALGSTAASTNPGCRPNHKEHNPILSCPLPGVPGAGGCSTCGFPPRQAPSMQTLGDLLLPTDRTLPGAGLPSFDLTFDSQRFSLLDLGDQTHQWSLLLTSSYDAGSGKTYFYFTPPEGSFALQFHTTDLVTFTYQPYYDHGRAVDGKMRVVDGQFEVENEFGLRWRFPIPGNFDRTVATTLRASRVIYSWGQTVDLIYDGTRLTSVVGALGSLQLQWVQLGADWVVSSMTGWDGRTTTFGYTTVNGRRILSTITHPDTSVSTATWNLTARTLPNYAFTFTTRSRRMPNHMPDGRGRQVTYWMDTRGLVARAEDALGRPLYARVANGIYEGLIWRQVRDHLGRTRLSFFDSSGNLRRLWEPDTGADMSFDVVPATSKAMASHDELGRTTRYGYHPANFTVTSTTHPDGSTTAVQLDTRTKKYTQMTDELGRITKVVRDSMGLPREYILPDASPGDDSDNPRRWEYHNSLGQLVRAVDEAGRETLYLYAADGDSAHAATAWDSAGNSGYLVRVELPREASTETTAPAWTYQWNMASKDLVQATTPMGQQHVLAYDLLHRPTRHTYADTSYEEDVYGSPTGPDAGLVVSRRDRNGRITTSTFDASGLETQRTLPDGGIIATTFDGYGRVASRSNLGDTETHAYDNAGRLASTTRTPRSGVALTTSTSFDSANRSYVTADPYGRRTWQAFDTEDRAVRTVRELSPGALNASLIDTAYQAALSDDAVGWGLSIFGGTSPLSTWTQSGGVWTVRGLWNINSTADQGAFVNRVLDGDADLQVRVLSNTGSANGGAKAGLMVRETATATSRMVFLGVQDPGKIVFLYRLGTEQFLQGGVVASNLTLPCTLRLSRSQGVWTASYSTDGSTWTSAGSQVLRMGRLVAAGVMACSNTYTLGTATFDNLSIAVTGTAPEAHRVARVLPRLQRASSSDLLIADDSYQANGLRIAHVDGRGVSSTWAYDARNRLAQQVEAAGSGVAASTAFTVDAVGNQTRIVTPSGLIIDQTWTARDQLASRTEGVGTAVAATVFSTYTANGRLRTQSDPRNAAWLTTYTYGGCCDRLQRITDPDGHETAFAYDFVGNRITVTDPNSVVQVTAFDTRNRILTQQRTGSPEILQYAYDDNLTDSAGIDAVPAVAAVLPTLGFVAGVADGSAVAITNALQETAYEIRDGVGRTVASIDALGHATRVTHDALVGGLVETAVTDALGHVTRARSDGGGRTLQQVDALGNVSTSAFDAAGNQIGQRDALGIGWDATYDDRGRRLTQTTTRQDVTVTTSWSFDIVGNLLSETDATGQTTTNQYDIRSRRIAIIDRVNGTTRFGYDLGSNLIVISDADNEPNGGLANLAGTTQYAYNARNLLTAEAFPTGQQGRTLRVYDYDGARRLLTRQVGILDGAFSAAPAFAGAVTTTTYVYSIDNRLTSRSYSDGLNDGFGYDQAGRLTSATSARSATTVGRDYDAAGRLTSESLTVPDGVLTGTTLAPTTWTVGSSYLDDNTLASQTYPTGSVVSRTWTDRHELATVSLGTDRVVQRTFDDAGRLTTSVIGPVPGLHTETRTYIPGDYLVASIAIPGVTGFSYTFDAGSRKTAETDAFAAGGGQTFGYDTASRLTSWTAGAAAAQSWILTKVGDWTSTTRDGVTEAREHKPVHEVVQVGPNILSYDVQGNLTKDERGTALAWDPENRLIRARVTRDASVTGFGSVATYRTDALGRRIAKTVDGTTTFYLPAGAQTVVEIDRPALPPSQAAIDGAEADGALANLAEAPASGGILPGTAGTVTRINFQPATTATPAGFIRDTGKALAVRTNGLSYGWSADSTAQAVVRGGAVPLVEFDTFVQAQPDAGGANSWSIALPNGTYPVIVVAGDALSTEQTNHLLVGSVFQEDLTPSAPPGYQAGNFDGYALEVTVTDGTLTIAPGSGAYHAKLCFIEIGAAGTPGTLITPEITATLAVRIAQANTETGANPIVRNGQREYIYGSYIDEAVAFVQTVGGVSQRYYPHNNHLYSVAALTNAVGDVVERYAYTAYGKQTRTVMPGKVGTAFGRGFTGYIVDQESSLLHARARMYSPSLGRFVSRDPTEYYFGGISQYGSYFIPHNVDPYGLFDHPPMTINPPLTTLGLATAAAIYNALKPECEKCKDVTIQLLCVTITIPPPCTKEECEKEAWEIAQHFVSAVSGVLKESWLGPFSPGGWGGNLVAGLWMSSGCVKYMEREHTALAFLGLKCWTLKEESAWRGLRHQWLSITNVCSGRAFDSKSWDFAWPRLEARP